MRTFTLPQREKDELYIHLDLSLSLKGKVLNEATNFMHIWQLKGFCRFYITTRKSLRSNPIYSLSKIVLLKLTHSLNYIIA